MNCKFLFEMFHLFLMKLYQNLKQNYKYLPRHQTYQIKYHYLKNYLFNIPRLRHFSHYYNFQIKMYLNYFNNQIIYF